VSQNLPATPTLCPCLCTVCETKDHSVSSHDVFIGDFCTLCPTLRYVPSNHHATNPDLIFDNDGTKPFQSSVLDYFIEDNSCHYEQWSSDMITNRPVKTDFYKKTPSFKKDNPGFRWRTTLDSATRSNTQVNQQIEIPSVTLAAEVATFLGLIKKTGHRVQQLGPVVDSGASRHTNNCHRDVLTFLPTSFLMNPAIGPSVTMPAVLLGVQIMTHVGTTLLLPLPGSGVYDPTMPECLISVAQLLEAGYHIIFRLPQDYGTDGFDKHAYPHYGGFITITHLGTKSNPHDFIIVHFEKNTWRLPSPPHCAVRPLLETAQSAQEIQPDTINNLPLHWNKECVYIFSEKEQRDLQIQTTHKLQVKIFHDSLGHCNNLLLTYSLKKMGVSVKFLLPYINTYKCNTCTANLVIVTTPLLSLSLPEVPVVVTPVSTFVEPILDVCVDFADSCQIGRSGDRWFLFMVDKTTEYVSLYNTKTRSNPLVLLKEYLTFIGRKIRYLHMDNAKEFNSEEMLAFCRHNGIIIQPVIAYNHTGMCRVESYKSIPIHRLIPIHGGINHFLPYLLGFSTLGSKKHRRTSEEDLRKEEYDRTQLHGTV
jgi:hypothetical protein